MRSILTALITPCVVLAGSAQVLGQPSPAPAAIPAPPALRGPAPAPRPHPTPEALAGVDVDLVLEKAAALDMAMELALQDKELKPRPKALDEAGVPVKVRTDEAREKLRESPTPKAVRWKGSCDDGAIDSTEDADSVYDCGRQALDRGAWDEALQSFSRVAAARQGTRVAGALYWRAYSQNRLGQRAEALATLGELKSAYPASGWAAEANALDVEIRQSSGQRVSPDGAPDDDLKLLALQGLANADVESAIPMIEKLLKGAQSPRLKERALFVLAQSGKPAARDVVVRVARGGANPDLQLKAVQYLGVSRSPEALKVLGELYAANTDPTVRKAIIRGYGQANAREQLVTAARQESAPELRLEAVRQLGMLRAGTELGELYARESSPEVKKQILRGLATSGLQEKLLAIAQAESDPELRRTAIRGLGLRPDASTGTLLTQLYAKEQTTEVREAVLDALYTQGNGAALVTLARQEKDPGLKLAIVRRLSTMTTRSPEAKEYLLEFLK